MRKGWRNLNGESLNANLSYRQAFVGISRPHLPFGFAGAAGSTPWNFFAGRL